MKYSIFKRVSAWVLGVSLAVSSYAFAGNITTAYAASLNLVVKQLTNSGDTTSFTYNKNGLLTKSVSKSFYKTNTKYEGNADSNYYDSLIERSTENIAKDVNTTITTTYKYNKNNKITRKTEKQVTEATYHQIDPADSSVVADLGTITGIATTVTVFTYNKKGLATRSTATTTRIFSGSVAYVDKESIASYNANYGYRELDDGRVIVGYNTRDLNGQSLPRTIENAYFLDNPLNIEYENVKNTITYSDNGDGTFTKEHSKSTTGSGIVIKKEYPGASCYGIEDDGRVIPISFDPEKHSYVREDGTPYRGIYFEYVTKAVVESEPANSVDSFTVNKNDCNMGTVTTTQYSYDSKGRVKKAVDTTVDKNSYTHTYTYKDTSQYKLSGDDHTTIETDSATSKDEYSKESTSVVTSEYKYDKKGRVTKKTDYSDGSENSTETTTSSYTVVDHQDYVFVYDDGRPDFSYSAEITNSNPRYLNQTVTANGVSTSTITCYPYTETTTIDGHTDTVSRYFDPEAMRYTDGTGPVYTITLETTPVTATPCNTATKYTYDKKGDLKTAKLSGTQVETYVVKNPTYGNTIYVTDEKGELTEKIMTKETPFTNLDTYESTVMDKSNIRILVMNKQTKNRAATSSFSVSYRNLKLKAKGIDKTAGIVRKQQWIIKNGLLNGETGLY